MNSAIVLGRSSCFSAKLTHVNPYLRRITTATRNGRWLEQKRICQPGSKALQGYICVRNMAGQKPGGKVNPTAWIGLMGGLAIVVGMKWAIDNARNKEKKTAVKKAAEGKMALGGYWKLTDMHEKPISSDDLKGQWYFLYFGFCHCPDVCPETLEKMSVVMDGLAKIKDMPKIQLVFVTVDPERDTCAAMKQYCGEFHPDILGVTGSLEDVKAAAKLYRIYFSKGPKSEDGDYIVDHSRLLFLVGPTGELESFYSDQKTNAFIMKDVQQQVKQYSETQK